MTVIGASGHQSIPDAARAFICDEIEELLGGVPDDSTGVCSLAAGADQIFATAILRRCLGLHVVVPSDGYVATFKDPADRQQFVRLMNSAASVEALSFKSPSEAAFLAAGRRVVDLCDILVAVWDGKKARGLGGTADIVEYARASNREVRVVWPHGVDR